mgnify:CR=1 FL=1
MYQKDFILRIIEDFFRFLSVILKLRKEQRYDEALMECNETSLSLLRININTIENLQPEEFIKHVEGLSLLPQQSEILAGLMYERSEIYYASGDLLQARTAVEKALMLYRLNSGSTKTFSMDADAKIKRLLQLNDELKNN